MSENPKEDKVLNLKGLACPMPIVKMGQEINSVEVGQVIKAITTDPGSLSDFPAWAESSGHEVIGTDQSGGEINIWVKRLV